MAWSIRQTNGVSIAPITCLSTPPELITPRSRPKHNDITRCNAILGKTEIINELRKVYFKSIARETAFDANILEAIENINSAKLCYELSWTFKAVWPFQEYVPWKLFKQFYKQRWACICLLSLLWWLLLYKIGKQNQTLCSWAFSRREFSIVHRGEQKSLACMGAYLRGARGQDFAFALYLFKVRGTAVPLRHASDRERTAEPKETRAGRRLHQNTSAENTSCFPWQQCRWTGGEPSKPTRVSRSTNLKHTNHKSTENGTSRQKVY